MLVPVYDIANCGPRHRFVANGKLIHNSDVNPQNLGRDSQLRASIKAPKGYKIVAADLSNIELRLGLWLAGQEDKLDLIRQGRDLYMDMAATIYGKTYDEIAALGKKSRERTVAKVVSLASIYGTGATKLRDTLRIQGKVKATQEETQRMTDIYRGEYTAVTAAWQQGKDVLEALYHKQNYGKYLKVLNVTADGMWKPDGLLLAYPDLRWTSDKDGKMGYTYEQKRKTRDRVYGSKVFQRCLSPDTEVLTQRGWVRLLEVDNSDLLWDGIEWVRHEGVISKGDRHTIQFAGVDMTPDHRVLYAGGWVEAKFANPAHCVRYATKHLPEDHHG